jgi:hypothetical protein
MPPGVSHKPTSFPQRLPFASKTNKRAGAREKPWKFS